MSTAVASECLRIITSADSAIRNRSLDSVCGPATLETLLLECHALDRFRRTSTNLYERVRALFFLYAIHRFYIPEKAPPGRALIPHAGYMSLLNRRFEEAIEVFLAAQVHAGQTGASPQISSALAAAYRALGFQTLADQVRQSVRSLRGNQWMFRAGQPVDYPLTLRPEILQKQEGGLFPVLRECTPVRMDLTHSAWSDIFFLGMDFPEGARVLNISIDLAVRGGDSGAPIPPVEAYFRVIDEPVLRLTSVDLKATADLTSVEEVFDFARDYLGLLKSAVIAAGIVPPGMEGATQPLSEVLERLTQRRGWGIEIVSKVNGIPKGSRLAVSTNLLASLIAVCMRATGQIRALTGPLGEDDRRMVAARAILGEWLGGSGGGWQDSGGVWPGIKLIEGVTAAQGDPEFGISRGCLLPRHRVFSETDASPETRQKLKDSLVLVHGGMAQDVGPVLEMVTEKYLLRGEAEWQARKQAIGMLDEITGYLGTGDIRAIGATTQRNFDGPIQTIIPWAGNLYTDTLISRARAELGDAFQGFWMLGGMSGGGMGFLVEPSQKARAQDRLQAIMSETRHRLERCLPFAMEPVVYDFEINERGTVAQFLDADSSLMPPEYYSLLVPGLLRVDPALLSQVRRRELASFNAACQSDPRFRSIVRNLFDSLLPRHSEAVSGGANALMAVLEQHGFNSAQHHQIQAGLKSGRLGMAQNRLPATTLVEDVVSGDVFDATGNLSADHRTRGMKALAAGEVAVVTLAGGVGSRWTQGAGVVKALHPFSKLSGRHRSFIELHLAKSRRTGRLSGPPLPHIVTTSYLTHDAIARYLASENNYGYPGPVLLSPGRGIGLRMVPMERDLRFAWQETAHQMLDEQAQKMRENLEGALHGRSKRLHGQRAFAMSASGGSLVRNSQPASQWRVAQSAAGPPAIAVSVGAQHRYNRRGRGSRATRLAYRTGSGHDVRSHCAPDRRYGRWLGPCGWQAAYRRRDGPANAGARVAPLLLQQQYGMDRYRPVARRVRPVAVRPERSCTRGRSSRPNGGPCANLHHHQRREEAMGQSPGGRLSGCPVRKTMGGYDRPARSRVQVHRGPPAAGAATQGSGPTRWLAPRRVGRVCRFLV